MSKIIENLSLKIDEDLAERLQWMEPGYTEFRILKQSVDARRRHNPHFVYSVEVAGPGEKLKNLDYPIEKLQFKTTECPIIIGAGPAGLFAALRFVERGLPCRLFERGSQAEERVKSINRFWRYGELNPRNNVCFGEGGAGLYSDGKLITRIKSPHIPYVLQRLVKFGAPEEIQYLANPHVGSDRIRRVIPRLRDFLIAHGCEIHFDQKVEKLIFSGSQTKGVELEDGRQYFSEHVILATGHSAEDMLISLREAGVFLESKAFAMGLRIEHPQHLINQIQYRDFADHPKLGAANYKLAHHDLHSGIGVYSFCMCPGGYVLSAGTEADGLVCNGMSNFHRNSPFANSAIVVSVDSPALYSKDLWGGMNLRRSLEKEAFKQVRNAGGTKELPAQRVNDFWRGRQSLSLNPSNTLSGAKGVRLDQILPDWMKIHLQDGLEKFERTMKGFLSEDAQLYGVESRTSCPIRVTRHSETLQSLSHQGLYPCGEGAGYAGGITSAACDGIRIAEKITESLIGKTLNSPH